MKVEELTGKYFQQESSSFVLMPEAKNKSPLDVEGVDIDITAQEIVASIHESRKY